MSFTTSCFDDHIEIIAENGSTLIHFYQAYSNLTFRIEIFPRVKRFHFYFWKKVFEIHEQFYGALTYESFETHIQFDDMIYCFEVLDYFYNYDD